MQFTSTKAAETLASHWYSHWPPFDMMLQYLQKHQWFIMRELHVLITKHPTSVRISYEYPLRDWHRQPNQEEYQKQIQRWVKSWRRAKIRAKCHFGVNYVEDRIYVIIRVAPWLSEKRMGTKSKPIVID
jgi:hypothetical protein